MKALFGRYAERAAPLLLEADGDYQCPAAEHLKVGVRPGLLGALSGRILLCMTAPMHTAFGRMLWLYQQALHWPVMLPESVTLGTLPAAFGVPLTCTGYAVSLMTWATTALSSAVLWCVAE